MLKVCTKYSCTEEEGNKNSTWIGGIKQSITEEVMVDQGFEGWIGVLQAGGESVPEKENMFQRAELCTWRHRILRKRFRIWPWTFEKGSQHLKSVLESNPAPWFLVHASFWPSFVSIPWSGGPIPGCCTSILKALITELLFPCIHLIIQSEYLWKGCKHWGHNDNATWPDSQHERGVKHNL